MAAPAPIVIAEEPGSVAARLAFFLVHTAAVYLCALFFSPRLVSLWFNTIAPFLHAESSVRAADWYLQHLPLVSIVPAVIVGYFNVRGPQSTGSWAWVFPSVVLLYKFIAYRSPGSVLGEAYLSPFEYFFGIQPTMPTLVNPVNGDPVRILAQMFVTAPFYAGLAYSLGAVASKQRVVQALFSFGKRGELE